MGEYVISYEFESERFLSVYFEHDGWSDADFMQALRDGAHEDIVRAKTEPVELLRVIAAVNVDEWEIGREIEQVNGAWGPKPKVYVWRRANETEWRSDGERRNRPGRDNHLRPASADIEDGLQLIGDSIEAILCDLSGMPDWAAQMAPWRLPRQLRSARGRKRKFPSTGLAKQPGELNDDWVADRLGVDWQTPAKRRLRDKKLALPNSRQDQRSD